MCQILPEDCHFYGCGSSDIVDIIAHRAAAWCHMSIDPDLDIAVSLSQLYSPFPERISPHLPMVAPQTIEWAQRMQLLTSAAALRRFEAALYIDFAARVYPDAPPETLNVASDWCAWLFVFDDQFDDCYLGRRRDDAGDVLGRLLEFLPVEMERRHGISEPRSPLELSLADLWHRTAPHMSMAWRRRFYGHMRDYLNSYFWEIDNRAAQVAPDLTMYIEMRRDTGATWLGLDLIEYVEGAEVPVRAFDSLCMRTLNLTSIDAICWVNDIASYKKEMARGEVNNIVCIAQRRFEMGLSEAVDFVRMMQNSRVELFLRTQSQLPELYEQLACSDAERNAIVRYISGLEAWIRGNLDWSLHTARYLRVERQSAGGRVSWTENISHAPEDALAAPNVEARG